MLILLWSESTDSVRIVAFLSLRKLAVMQSTKFLNSILKVRHLVFLAVCVFSLFVCLFLFFFVGFFVVCLLFVCCLFVVCLLFVCCLFVVCLFVVCLLFVCLLVCSLFVCCLLFIC